MTIRPSLKATLVAGAALGALATVALPALAADLIEPTIIEAPIIEKVKPFGGWYIRGDVGYSFNEYRDEDFATDGLFKTQFNTKPPIPLFPERTVDDSAFLGVGVGGHLGQYLRADITADYQFNADMVTAFDKETFNPGCRSTLTVAECESGYSADMHAITVMANAYVDFGTYAGITPYVGAGSGFANIAYGDVTETDCALPANPGTTSGTPCGNNPNTVQTTAVYDGDSTLRLAWSVAAGASYDVNDMFAIDGGYRFVRVEEGYISHEAGIKDQGLDMHQIRVGARVKLH